MASFQCPLRRFIRVSLQTATGSGWGDPFSALPPGCTVAPSKAFASAGGYVAGSKALAWQTEGSPVTSIPHSLIHSTEQCPPTGPGPNNRGPRGATNDVPIIEPPFPLWKRQTEGSPGSSTPRLTMLSVYSIYFHVRRWFGIYVRPTVVSAKVWAQRICPPPLVAN